MSDRRNEPWPTAQRLRECEVFTRDILERLGRYKDIFTAAETLHIAFCLGAVEQEYARRLEEERHRSHAKAGHGDPR